MPKPATKPGKPAGKSASKSKEGEKEKVVAQNRAASYNYHLLERLEAGLVLHGTEVKALREGKANIRDAFVDQFYAAAKKLKIGHWREQVFMGPLISADAVCTIAVASWASAAPREGSMTLSPRTGTSISASSSALMAAQSPESTRRSHGSVPGACTLPSVMLLTLPPK